VAERERIEKMSIEEQMKIKMATDEQIRLKTREDRVRQELIQQRKAMVATQFEMAFSRVVPEVINTGILRVM
jgi:hypothetical protein